MVTVAIPLYNTEKYIERCLDSVLAQSYTDIEILLVDDCCTDNSLSVVDSVIKRNSTPIKIRVVHQDTNQGVALARNRAIKEARGEYLYFLDSDDMITPDCIELLHRNIVEHECNFVVGSYGYCREEEFPNLHNAIHEYADVKTNIDFYKYKYSYTKDSLFTIYIWNILFDINFIRNNELSFRPLRKSEDHIFFLEMMPYIDSCVILENVTYRYIIRGESLSCYSGRNYISSSEIKRSAEVYSKELDIVRRWSDNSYYPEIMFQQIRDAIWMIISIMRKESIIKPSLPDDSMKILFRHPLNIKDIFSLRRKKIFHLGYYLFGVLPVSLEKLFVRLYLKLRKWI